MTSDNSTTGDSASIRLPKHHELLVTDSRSALSYLRPFEHFGHSLEELLDLARTPFHGGDPVVAPETLVAAVQPARNAVRVVVRNAHGDLKQLILDKNCRTNSGGTWLNILMGGDTNANIGYENHSGAVAYTATTVTPTASPTWTVNQWTGHIVVAMQTNGAAATLVWGVIKSNTAPALTIDQWYSATYTGGAAATTPAVNSSFMILNGQGPATWLGMTADTAVEDIGDSALASEFTTNFTVAGRWKGVYSQTTAPTGTGTTNSSAIYKLDAGVLTANGTVTVAKLGLFNSFTGGIMSFEKKLTVAAAVVASDTLDPSWSVTDS